MAFFGCEISNLDNNFLTDMLGYKESGRDFFKVDKLVS